MYECGHEQDKSKKKRWNDKDVLLNRNNVNGKLKREVVVIPYHEPGPGLLTSYVVVFFLYERWLIVLLILVELMSITVWTFLSCNDYKRLHFDFTNIYWFAHLSSGEQIHCFGGKRYNDACFRIASPYRGLDTYAHIHKYLWERVVWLWLVEMYKSRHVIRRSFH